MSASGLRIGQGYDVHRLVAGRPLMLGGIKVPSDRGLDGHSDADVLLHALADALLGAVGLGDIGDHFPPDDDAWKDADSGDLLRSVRTLVLEAGYQVVNCDLSLVAERPKIAPYREQMRQRIADLLEVSVSCVGLKATTNERLGFVGRDEGMAALAVCLLEPLPAGD